MRNFCVSTLCPVVIRPYLCMCMCVYIYIYICIYLYLLIILILIITISIIISWIFIFLTRLAARSLRAHDRPAVQEALVTASAYPSITYTSIIRSKTWCRKNINASFIYVYMYVCIYIYIYINVYILARYLHLIFDCLRFWQCSYTQFPSQDSGLFGPNPWKILAPPSNYLS